MSRFISIVQKALLFILDNPLLVGIAILIWWMAWSQHQHNNELESILGRQ